MDVSHKTDEFMRVISIVNLPVPVGLSYDNKIRVRYSRQFDRKLLRNTGNAGSSNFISKKPTDSMSEKTRRKLIVWKLRKLISESTRSRRDDEEVDRRPVTNFYSIMKNQSPTIGSNTTGDFELKKAKTKARGITVTANLQK